jgi:hypothetical protein
MEYTYVKHWLDSREIIYYKRYVDDIFLIFDLRKTDENTILHRINNMDTNLQFKLSTEENRTINYLDISIYRNHTHLAIGMYRKPPDTGTVIHFTSNHPHEQKMSAFH